jgi:uncharacterized small protein (DUF1192 family)
VNKIQQFAADLKARKGVGKRTPRNDAATHTPPAAPSGLRGSSTIERLKAELRSAKERACKAEAALAAVERFNGKIADLNNEIARLRVALQVKPIQPAREASGNMMRRLVAAWKRIEALQSENEHLRNQAKGDRDSHTDQRT